MPVAILLAFALLTASATAFAQDAPPAGGTMVTLDFQDAEITEVIGVIAQATGKNFLYDDRVRGRVTVISPEPVTADEAYRVFESILQVKGFTTVPSPGGILKIVPLRDAKENPLDTVTGERPLENRDLFITRLIPAALREGRADQRDDQAARLQRGERDLVRADQHADHHRLGGEHPPAREHHRPDRRVDLSGADQADPDPLRGRGGA